VNELVLDGPVVRWQPVEPEGLEHRGSEACKAGADTMRRAPLYLYDGPG
jgi:hypothetical protein